MPRVKRGTSHVKRRKNLLAQTKGYKWGRKKLVKAAKTAINKAGAHAYKGRKVKKRINRRTWQIQINAAARANDLTYSKMINLLKTNKIDIDRKALSELAKKAPKAFDNLLAQIKK